MHKPTWQDVADDAVLVGGFGIFAYFFCERFNGDEMRNIVFLFAWTVANRLRGARNNRGS